MATMEATSAWFRPVGNIRPANSDDKITMRITYTVSSNKMTVTKIEVKNTQLYYYWAAPGSTGQTKSTISLQLGSNTIVSLTPQQIGAGSASTSIGTYYTWWSGSKTFTNSGTAAITSFKATVNTSTLDYDINNVPLKFTVNVPSAKYTVTYYRNNTSTDTTNVTQSITAGSTWTTKSTSAFTRTNYTMGRKKADGSWQYKPWNTARDGSGTGYASSTSQSARSSNLSLYARWFGAKMPSGSNVVFKPGVGGTQSSSYSKAAYYGETMAYPSYATAHITAKPGYQAANQWCKTTATNATNYAAANSTPTATVGTAMPATLYAKFTPITNGCKVVFNANGGTGAPSTISFTIGNSVTIPTTPTPTRAAEDSVTFTFKGWSKSSDATSASYIKGKSYTFTAETTTLYAVWATTNKPYITYDLNGGTSTFEGPYSQYINLNSNTTAGSIDGVVFAAPTKPNSTFKGWSENEDATTATYTHGSSVVSSVANDMTFYAVYTGNPGYFKYYNSPYVASSNGPRNKSAALSLSVGNYDGNDWTVTIPEEEWNGIELSQKSGATYSTDIAEDFLDEDYKFIGLAPADDPETVIYFAGGTYSMSPADLDKTYYPVYHLLNTDDENGGTFIRDIYVKNISNDMYIKNLVSAFVNFNNVSEEVEA